MCSLVSTTILITYLISLAYSQSSLSQSEAAIEYREKSNNNNRINNNNIRIPLSNKISLDKSSKINLAQSLKCHVREYTYKAIRRDDYGRSCWQYLTIKSCWGRCDSSEVRDN